MEHGLASHVAGMAIAQTKQVSEPEPTATGLAPGWFMPLRNLVMGPTFTTVRLTNEEQPSRSEGVGCPTERIRTRFR